VVYVLDACALLAFLNNEPGSDTVAELLKNAVDGNDVIYMSIVNLLEVHYCNVRNLGQRQAAALLAGIRAAPIQIVDAVSDAVFDEAARLKASYKCSIADTIGIATAQELSGQFVTSDHHELEVVEKGESFVFLWLPSHPKKNKP
jgi:predicted nucleic acid-binding protein